MSKITIDYGGTSCTLQRDSVASVDTKRCINCGTCRENCPVDAITEAQRRICRICPSCTEQPGMTPQEVDDFCTKQSCTTACPLGISPQGYLGLLRNGKQEKAWELIWKKNPLPSVCARICHHPCEQVCKRGALVDEPMAIRDIKRYLSDTVAWERPAYPHLHDERIAVVGAGPSGLSAGHFLSVLGYDVTVFEANAEPGGMLVRGIPEFRLDRGAVRRDIQKLQDAGLTIRCGEVLGKKQLKEIQAEYDAVVIAAGKPHGKEITWVPKWNFDGVYTAIQFMDFANNNQETYRMPAQNFVVRGAEGVVVGGGSVAMDAARTAIRLGAKKVTCVCLEEGENVPAYPWERKEAEEEGITFVEGYSPKAYTGRVNTLEGVDFVKVVNFRKDSSGKIAFDTDEKKVLHIPCTFLISAIGQYADPIFPEADGKTVFYAGDIAGGPSSVIDALASGRKAAYAVDAAMMDRTLRNASVQHEIVQAPKEEKIYPCNRRKVRLTPRPLKDPAERAESFDDVERTFTEREAKDEVLRCLGCGYALVDETKCIGCGVCQALCPEGDVITMVKRKEA